MIRLDKLSKYYQSEGNVTLGLSKVSTEFKLGEFVVITGESGSGKSTLLNVISGIDTYEDGEMYFNGEETSYFDKTDWENYRRENISFVFQNYGLIDSYTVYENVLSAMIINNQDDVEKRALEIIESVGLLSHLTHKGTKLSGGQKQRLAIARALAKDCNILVADEPTGNLDSETGKEIIALLKEISKTKLVVMVTHNFDEVKDVATRKIRVFNGKIAEDIVVCNVEVKQIKKEKNYKKNSLRNSLFFSKLNIKSQPRRTIFTFIVTIFMSILVGLVLTNYVYFASSDTTSSVVNQYFNNIEKERVVVKNKDNSDITSSQYKELSEIKHVESIFIYDEILDLDANGYFNTWFYNFTFNSVDRISSEIVEGRLPKAANEVVLSLPDYQIEDNMIGDGLSLELTIDKNLSDTTLEFVVVGVVKAQRYEKVVYGNNDFFAELSDDYSQHSLFIDDIKNIDSVFKELEELGYLYISPYQASVIENDSMLVLYRIMMMGLSIVFIIAIYLLGYIVLNLIFSQKKKDFGILKSIGMDKNTILNVNVIELTIYFVISFLFAVLVIEVLSLFVSFFEFFYWYHYSYLLVINLLIGLFTAIRFNQSINKKSVMQTIKEK